MSLKTKIWIKLSQNGEEIVVYTNFTKYIRLFVTIEEKKITTWQTVKLKKKNKKTLIPVKVVNYNINAANYNVLTMMQ